VPAVNPRDAALVPGGSSSGSAVAVATGLAPLSFGTDTGGSIRTPAAFNGVVGFMPARNVVDASGMNHLSPSLDRIGPIAADVDSAYLGWRSSTGDSAAVPELPALDAADCRIGVLSGPTFDELDEIVATGYDAFLSRLGGRRAPRTVVIDATPGIEAQGAIVAAEAWRLYGEAALDEHSGMGAEVAARVRAGRDVGEEAYALAQRRAQEFETALQRLLDEVDLLICPTTPVAIPRVGEREHRRADGSVEHVYRAVTRHTSAFNVASVSALAVPYDTTSAHSLAVQIIARPGDEERAFGLAATIERKHRK
jgi:aspartyl-tRNA(Asn)/glutamyl-tRNA(Gln) amidotransferase subunit A